jgi:RNA-binding protein
MKGRIAMRQLTNVQRQHLRRLANPLRPLVQIGKQGLTDGVRTSVDRSLESHELIKVKFLDFQDQKEELTGDLVESTNSILVALVGNTATLYREQPDPEKRKIDLPE